jgi:hypothetical protein
MNWKELKNFAPFSGEQEAVNFLNDDVVTQIELLAPRMGNALGLDDEKAEELFCMCEQFVSQKYKRPLRITITKYLTYFLTFCEVTVIRYRRKKHIRLSMREPLAEGICGHLDVLTFAAQDIEEHLWESELQLKLEFPFILWWRENILKKIGGLQ